MTTIPILGISFLLASLTGVSSDPAQAPQSAGSRRVVVLRLHDQAIPTALVSVAIGSSATLSMPGLPVLGISPTLLPDGRLQLTAGVRSLVGGAASLPADPATMAPISLGATAHVEVGAYVLDVDWVDDKSLPQPSAAETDGEPECCVICEGVGFCGCRVQAPCGGCCEVACGPCGHDEGQREHAGGIVLK
jgi:hypothetical protein